MADNEEDIHPEPAVEAVETEAPEQEEAATGVHTTVTRTSAYECTVRVEVEAERLRKDYEEGLTTLQNETALLGFRKGKAPRGLIERRFAKRVKAEVLGTVAGEAYEAAIKENDLTVVAELETPDFEDVEWQVGEPAEFEFKCEVLPEIDLQDEHYKGLTVDVPALEVTDEVFEEEMRRFARQMANWQPVEGQGIDWEDFVEAEVSLVGEGDDSAWSGKLQFHPKDEQIGPFNVPGLKGAVMDAKTGDTLELEAEVDQELAEDAEAALKDLAGHAVKIKATISGVHRLNIPEINDELAEKIGLQSADEVRSVVRDRLEKRLESQKKEAGEQAVLDAVLERVEMEMPPSLVERAARDEQRKIMVRALRTGVSRDRAEELVQDTASRSRRAAVRQLKMAYLLKRIAEAERIVVLDTEEQEQLRALAARQGWTERRAQRYMEDNDLMGSLREQVREEKTLRFVVENAELKEIDVEEFTRRMREKAAAEQAQDQEEAAENAQETEQDKP